ncbi:hypothetical protein GCK72_007862 [Caenorhabditis remanei]|uniref:F-box associated domain-containing protein n=1 Tax=Caenorhabditis remanei TaxID=31234 RepID=A0A6A5HQ12_CAERE|nr:hypothetical protein GCK72_007862 [Caenorhabditis remanei]KAF1767902.1 hypothetical protein GCK72_007862 [Caenorhabditis remanei]
MENQEVLRSKPLSYEASKAVLKSLRLETREAINRRIPELRNVNSRLPYVLENVVISDDFFETDGRRWIIRPVWVQSSENPLRQVVDPEKSEVAIYQDTQNSDNPLKKVVGQRRRTATIRQNKPRKETYYSLNKSPEEIWYQLFDEYVKNGTVVRGSLRFSGIPEFMKRKSQNEVDLKMKVTNLELDIYGTNDYDHFFRFIDLDVLENVKCVFGRNSLAILDKPEIKTCKNLTVEFCFGSRPANFSNDKLLRLRNQHLQLENYGLTLHELQLLVQDWITAGRDIGTRFSWEPRTFDDVVDHLNRLKTHFGGVEAGSNLDYYFSNKKIHGNVITLKMGEDRELVMYRGESKTDYLSRTFEMEVVASITATGTVPTSDV